MKKRFRKGGVYLSNTGPYDRSRPEYCYYKPADSDGGEYIVDCWVVNRRGNRHPGYSVSPIPVNVKNFI